MRLTTLTFIILELNALIDTGKHNNLSLGEIKRHMESGDVFRFVSDIGKDNIDLSLLKDRADEEAEIVAQLQDMVNAFAGNERRKWGVENNGLCLLLAWINEMVQLRRWTD